MAIIVHSLGYNPSTFGWYKGFTLTLETPISCQDNKSGWQERALWRGHTMCDSSSPSPPRCVILRGRSSTSVAYSDNCHRTPDVADSSLTRIPSSNHIIHPSSLLDCATNLHPKTCPILKADKFLCLLVRDSCLWRDLLEFRPHGVFVGEDADNVFMCSVNRMWDM